MRHGLTGFFFLNQLDHTINLWVACLCGDEFPGGGQVQIDVQKLRELLVHGFVGMNALFLKHHFPEENLRVQSEGLGRLGRLGLWNSTIALPVAARRSTQSSR